MTEKDKNKIATLMIEQADKLGMAVTALKRAKLACKADTQVLEIVTDALNRISTYKAKEIQ